MYCSSRTEGRLRRLVDAGLLESVRSVESLTFEDWLSLNKTLVGFVRDSEYEDIIRRSYYGEGSSEWLNITIARCVQLLASEQMAALISRNAIDSIRYCRAIQKFQDLLLLELEDEEDVNGVMENPELGPQGEMLMP